MQETIERSAKGLDPVKPELIDAVDLVTEMTLVKHPFREGVRGQLGVEF